MNEPGPPSTGAGDGLGEALPEGLLVRSPKGCYLRTHVQPGARRDAVTGLHGAALKLAVRAPAVSGRANRAVADLLRSQLGIGKGELTLVAGERSRDKVFLVEGVDCERVHRAIAALGPSRQP